MRQSAPETAAESFGRQDDVLDVRRLRRAARRHVGVVRGSLVRVARQVLTCWMIIQVEIVSEMFLRNFLVSNLG